MTSSACGGPDAGKATSREGRWGFGVVEGAE